MRMRDPVARTAQTSPRKEDAHGIPRLPLAQRAALGASTGAQSGKDPGHQREVRAHLIRALGAAAAGRRRAGPPADECTRPARLARLSRTRERVHRAIVVASASFQHPGPRGRRFFGRQGRSSHSRVGAECRREGRAHPPDRLCAAAARARRQRSARAASRSRDSSGSCTRPDSARALPRSGGAKLDPERATAPRPQPVQAPSCASLAGSPSSARSLSPRQSLSGRLRSLAAARAAALDLRPPSRSRNGARARDNEANGGSHGRVRRIEAPPRV